MAQSAKTKQQVENWYIVADKLSGKVVEIVLLTEKQAEKKRETYDVWLAMTDGVYID